MAGFLYFLPDERTFQPSHLVEYGLTHIVDAGETVNRGQVIRGPDGKPGMVIGAAANWSDAEVKWSDRLSWRPFPKPHAAKQALCCWVTDDPPGPSDLERSKQLTGEVLTLADGRGWLVPHARRWDDGQYTVAVPRTIDVNDDGQFVYGDVLPQYRAIWDHACRYWETITNAAKHADNNPNLEIEFDNPLQLIVDALSANYRVSARELGILQAIDDQQFHAVASILVDTAGMAQLQKKTDSDTGNG